MLVIEITLGAEVTRPGPAAYSSNKRSATVKMQVHPGDTINNVLAEARRVLNQALAEGQSVTMERDAVRAATKWRVRVGGPRPADRSLRALGLRWVDGVFVGEYEHEVDAEKARDAARLMNASWSIHLDAPAQEGS